MKTILVDAWNTFVTKDGVDKHLHTVLESYPNKKIIVTNTNNEQIIELGLVNLPYELFTLKHNPDKIDPNYFLGFLEKFNLTKDDVVYFEHNPEAVKSAESIGIVSFNFDKDKRDTDSLKAFLDQNL